jgi:hypothetical protein
MKMVLLMAATAFEADLQWDHPADWDIITGYTVYFTDGTDNYNKTVLKGDLTTDGVAVTYPAMEDKLNIHYDVEYSIYITAYNDDGESGPSNAVIYTRSGYVPPQDVLPEPLPGISGSPGNLDVK